MMRSWLNSLGGGVGAASLSIAGLAAVAIPTSAHASAWGCQVVLCLATPGSPTTYAECVAPITKLWNVLASGGSFPTCEEGGVGTTTSKIKHGYALAVTMPDGTSARYTINTKDQTIAAR